MHVQGAPTGQHAVDAESDALSRQEAELTFKHIDRDAIADDHRTTGARLQQGLAFNADVGIHAQAASTGAQHHGVSVEFYQAQGLVVDQRDLSCRIGREAGGRNFNRFTMATQGADGALRLECERTALQVDPGIAQAVRAQRFHDVALQ